MAVVVVGRVEMVAVDDDDGYYYYYDDVDDQTNEDIKSSSKVSHTATALEELAWMPVMSS